MVSQAGLFSFAATGVFVGPSLDGGRSDSPLDGGLDAALVFRCAAGPTLFDNPPDATRPLGFAIGLTGAFAPGPTVLDSGFLGAPRVGRTDELTLRAMVPVPGAGGRAAGFRGAVALSARVMRFAAGGLRPVSWSLRLAPPIVADWVVRREALNTGGASWEVVSGSSGIEGGAGPRMEGLLNGEPKGEVIRMIFGDLSASTTLEGDAIFDG